MERYSRTFHRKAINRGEFLEFVRELSAAFINAERIISQREVLKISVDAFFRKWINNPAVNRKEFESVHRQTLLHIDKDCVSDSADTNLVVIKDAKNKNRYFHQK